MYHWFAFKRPNDINLMWKILLQSQRDASKRGSRVILVYVNFMWHCNIHRISFQWHEPWSASIRCCFFLGLLDPLKQLNRIYKFVLFSFSFSFLLLNYIMQYQQYSHDWKFIHNLKYSIEKQKLCPFDKCILW